MHQIVAAAFLGPRPDGHDVRHLDGNPLNSALSNLSYGTRSENELDKARHGTNPNARKTHCPQGHPYDEANTYRLGRHRTCRTCANASARRRYRQRKESTSSVAPGWTPTTSKEKAS
ncbi:HNH endonuclease signature motif containing protein [Streptomyces europaeiscabiei]|uniref:HNH endonuclease signature motif containing protein n=1 Tax=Streptomyces europaeiscabiei TaxID=146819 RepID=UPI0029A11926|nr:HNH endonuclease signature motif containing protein [Streptomyces europaeiscabiei]MDX3713446.1 HNH endonuclease signature motif containing protein [Streptomyces europaeiscabiei]